MSESPPCAFYTNNCLHDHSDTSPVIPILDFAYPKLVHARNARFPIEISLVVYIPHTPPLCIHSSPTNTRDARTLDKVVSMHASIT